MDADVQAGEAGVRLGADEGERGVQLAADTWFALHRAGHAASRVVLEHVQPHGGDPRHYLLLTGLEELGPRTQQQLTAAIGIDRSSIVHAIDELERQGLAERHRCATDRRAYAVHITDAGRRRLAELQAAVTEAQRRILTPLTDAECRQLHDLLTRLDDRLRNNAAE